MESSLGLAQLPALTLQLQLLLRLLSHFSSDSSHITQAGASVSFVTFGIIYIVLYTAAFSAFPLEKFKVLRAH